jgi:hypothetical protein
MAVSDPAVLDKAHLAARLHIAEVFSDNALAQAYVGHTPLC